MIKSLFKINPNTTVPSEQRQLAYQTLLYKADNEPLIPWGAEALTVDSAVLLYSSYMAENTERAKEKMAEISVLIAAAKEYIRTLYPDVGGEA